MSEEVILVSDHQTTQLKKGIAQILYQHKFEQSRISSILHLSQPMVSNYCASKETLPINIIHLAKDIADKIMQHFPLNFHTCIMFTDKPYEGQYFVAKPNELLTDEAQTIVDTLTEAFLLLKGKDIAQLIPQVKINIAQAKHHAKTSDDIAAFVNGLIIADNKVIGINGVRFGTSKHLSSLLLYLKQHLDISAIMNISFLDDLGNHSFKYTYLTKDFKLEKIHDQIDILLHRGDFGLEPCSYVVGIDAIDVAKKVTRLLEECP
jgi:predicted fused transcriptional regulator/phosphomethylpyrimidine kinase